jgi:predicted nuclease of predicted toxin-antitoxin system
VEQLRFAAQLGCVLVTQDRDFIALAVSERPHTGVIVLQRDMSIGRFIEHLELMAACYEPAEMQNRLEFCDW